MITTSQDCWRYTYDNVTETGVVVVVVVVNACDARVLEVKAGAQETFKVCICYKMSSRTDSVSRNKTWLQR